MKRKGEWVQNTLDPELVDTMQQTLVMLGELAESQGNDAELCWSVALTNAFIQQMSRFNEASRAMLFDSIEDCTKKVVRERGIPDDELTIAGPARTINLQDARKSGAKSLAEAIELDKASKLILDMGPGDKPLH